MSKESTELLEALLAGDAPRFHPNTGQNLAVIGLIDAPFTSFHTDGEVNLEPIERYAQMLQHNGLKGVFINGLRDRKSVV